MVAYTDAEVASIFGVGEGPGACVGATLAVSVGAPAGVWVAAGEGVGSGEVVPIGEENGDGNGEPHAAHSAATIMAANGASTFLC
ncbi:MAG: hypothetical protein M1434_01790 [Chloroflexi bacterium]|nr:hypothetical protein [Chloroflexota bacterium]MCL5273460.1 hypothetical protein [Chloroflexota bacterium]